MATYADDVQFAGLVEAATAAADEHQRNLKRKRQDAFINLAPELAIHDQIRPKDPFLKNSAAILFREPSEKSKKYSRPPLGKLFNTLELSVEAFLELQNAAKDFMLDDNHPERRNVVGYKKSNINNDIAKLKLWNCVDEFLRLENVGEKFFGHQVNINTPEAPVRTFFWPQDHQRIIKLLMPLLRKIITNERQRVYAAESRKSTGKTGERQLPDDGQLDVVEDAEVSDSGRVDHVDKMTEYTQQVGIDPALRAAATIASEMMHQDNQLTEDVPVKLLVNIVSGDGQNRVTPEFVLLSNTVPTVEVLTHQLEQHCEHSMSSITVNAWLPQGLFRISEDSDWTMACMMVSSVPWMDNQLKIIVEVPLMLDKDDASSTTP